VNIITVPERELDDFTADDFGGKRVAKTACIVRYGGFGDMIQTLLCFLL